MSGGAKGSPASHILIADDDPGIGRILCDRLRELGHEVEPVSYTHLTLPTIYSV